MFNFKFNKSNIFGKGFYSKWNNRSNRFIGEYKVIAQSDLYDFLKQDVYVLDVRTEREFKGMRIKNAINIPLYMLNRNIQSIIPDKESKILVYCMSGDRARLAIQKLNNMEYKNIYIWGNGGLNTLKLKELLEY
ncbi:MAG: rhodanese-like domain-containing protein [Clostridia bacterium]|nr:rhodanese-like domain-containing protein [Clostridia bacterium]MDD4386683.1 rhodanese-like domain-containing protein [Clostridia bacterium]